MQTERAALKARVESTESAHERACQEATELQAEVEAAEISDRGKSCVRIHGTYSKRNGHHTDIEASCLHPPSGCCCALPLSPDYCSFFVNKEDHVMYI